MGTAVTTSHSDAFIAAQQSASAAAIEDGQMSLKEQAWQQNLNEIIQCPDCREFPPNLVEEFSSGDMVCGSCGLVLGDRIIDTRSEWRTFANDDQNNDDPSRVGDSVNPLLNGSQLETNIAFEGKDARELQRLQNKAAKKNDKDGNKSNNTALLAAYREISNFCDAMNISKTTQDAAKHIFKMTDDAKYFKGKSSEVIIAGCIFIACRQSNAPRTFREIFALTKVPKKEIGRTFKMLEKFLQDDKNKTFVRPINQDGMPPTLTRHQRHRTLREILQRAPFQQQPPHGQDFFRAVREEFRCQRSGRSFAFICCCRLHLHDFSPHGRGQELKTDCRSGRRQRWYN
ncbi:hypothetical protein E0Z10_g6563 [Xylaria hypoxylon]|uniref:General transcription factor TFIIB n=1 Tax=Xylaria hypoxylon TaxID=37992 RepID=A0A4Z0YUW5_9PEZI|nr:hypothetical protein E0Z10_g6563 [Xylaria hypoxylon]